jgi:hypothetical protein
MPRSCEQSGRLPVVLTPVVLTPRDAGGTVSLCVATRARRALGVFRALSAALFCVPGMTVCCGIASALDAALFVSCESVAVVELAAAFEDEVFEAGVGVDGVDEGVACGAGADGDPEVVGWLTGVVAAGDCGPLCASAPPCA